MKRISYYKVFRNMILFLSLFMMETRAQTTIFQFNFESGTTASTDNAVGTPTFSTAGTLGSLTTNTPCNGSGAYQNDAWNTGDAYRFTVNTTGYARLQFSYFERTSNTGISNFSVRVSVNGSTWTTVRNNYVPTTSCASSGSISISDSFSQRATLYIEIYKSNNAGNTGNNYRIDDVTLTGVVIPEFQPLPYTNNFGTAAFNTYPTGFQGLNGVNGSSINSKILAEASTPGSNATLTSQSGNFVTEPAGGLRGFAFSGNGQLALSSSNDATNGLNQPILAIQTGASPSDILFSYDLEVLFSGARTFGIALQYKAVNSSSWTTVNGSETTYNSPTLNSVTSFDLIISGLQPGENYLFRWISWRNHSSGATNTTLGLDNISVQEFSGASISGITPQTSNDIPQGSNDVVLAGFRFTPASSMDFTGITLDFTGTAAASDLHSFRIFRDFNGDGEINGADSGISGGGQNYASSLVFSLNGETGIATSRNYLVVASAEATAILGRTIQVSLDEGNFTLSSGVALGTFTGNILAIDGQPPVLTADNTDNTVDEEIEITFTDDPAWRSAVTSVEVNGVTLSGNTPDDYDLLAGILRLKPSASSNAVLKSSGSKSVVVVANGYANTLVNQEILPGEAYILSMSQQPAAPATNGGDLSVQPVVLIKDQFGNTVTSSSAAVTAAVGNGSWTLGGAKVVNAVSGQVTFTNLNATSSAQVNGATITFSATGIISVTSSGFTVPAPDHISISQFATAINENFNSLASSSTSSTLPQGWYFTESGTNANSTYTAGNGSSSTGDTYSLGVTSNSDRALGSLLSGSLNAVFGAKFRNSTGGTIGSLVITYTGETWRVGSASRSDRLDFSYSTNATGLGNGTWTNLDSLDYANNGQATANGSLLQSKTISATIANINLAPGATIFIRWTDADASGSDDAMGIDDFSITALPTLTHYYHQTSGTGCAGDLHDLDCWTTGSGGTGTTPLSFTDDYQVFNIVSGNRITTAAWTVSGISSRVVVGGTSYASRTLTISSGNPVTGTIDIAQAGSGSGNSVVVGATVSPTFGTLHNTADITFNAAGSQSIPALSLDNLTLDGTGEKSLQGNLTIRGVLTIKSGVTANFGTYIVSGTGDIDLQAGAIFRTANTGGINGTDQTSGGSLYSTSGSYQFDGGSNQVLGSYFPDEVDNLTISNALTDISLNEDLTINGELDIEGNLKIENYTLTLNGTLQGSGTLQGNGNGSSVTIGGSGVFGTIRMNQSQPGISNRIVNLTFNRASGTITLGNEMQVSGIVTHTNGTLESAGFLKLTLINATTYGQISGAGSGDISGAIAFETLIPGTSDGWRNFCMPLDTITAGQLGAQMIVALQNNTQVNGFPYDMNLFTWNETSKTWNGISNPGLNLYGQGINAYVFKPSSSVIALKGLYRKQDFNYGQLSFTSSGTAANDGWHLLVNPYPSGLDWNSLNKPLGIQGNYALWSQQDGNYRNWDGLVGAAGQFIPPAHAYWVKVNSTLTADFIATSADRVSNTNNHFQKRSAANVLKLTVTSAMNSYRDQIWLYSNGMLDKDSVYGAGKLDGLVEAPSFWMIKDTRRYATLGVSTDAEELIGLGFRAPVSGIYEMTAGMMDMEPGCTYWLEDKKENKWHLLGDKNYSFSYTQGEPLEGRFFIRKKQETTGLLKRQNNTLELRAEGNNIVIVSREKGVLQISDLTGRVVLEVDFEAGTSTIQLPASGLGLLIVKAATQTENRTLKVIKP